MVTAGELLASVNDHKHVVEDTDTYFVIDPKTRVITNTAGKNTVMQYDHNSETCTFEVPRFIDGHDMTLCNRVRIHFNNIDTSGRQFAEDVDELPTPTVNDKDTSTVITTWTITRNATQLAGTLNFLIQYICVSEDGEMVYEWHTDIYDAIEVKAGRNNDEAPVVNNNSLLESWYQRLFGAGDSAIERIEAATEEQKTNIENKGAEVLATIPEDYTTLDRMTNQAIRTRANAIVASGDGSTIVVNDCSDDYLRGLNLYGKTTQTTTTGAQLLNVPDAVAKVDRGLTQTIANGVCTVNGTVNSTAAFNLTLAGLYASTTPLFELAPGTYTATDCIIYNYDGTTRTSYSGTFTLTNSFEVTWVATKSYSVGEYVDEVTYPMINAGDSALPWEPYTGGIASPSPNYPQPLTSIENPTIDVYGKNLLPPREASGSGYTATVNDDGSITVTGAASTTNSIYLTVSTLNGSNPLKLPRNKTYHMWGESPDNVNIGTKTLDSNGNPYWSTVQTWDKYNGTDRLDLVQIYLESNGHEIGDTKLCGTYRFQLEVGDEFTGFEGYKPKQTIAAKYTLRGIPVSSGGNYTDEDGQQWVCDEVDFERGVHIQRIANYVFDGSSDENWNTYDAFNGAYMINDLLRGSEQYSTPLLCNYAKRISWGDGSKDKHYCFLNGYDDFVIGGSEVMTKCPDITTFKAQLTTHPCEVHYILAEPIETPLTDEELFNFSQLHSNYLTTTAMSYSGPYMRLSYNADTKAYFDNSRGATDEQVSAAVEAWMVKYIPEYYDGSVTVS